MEEEKFLVSLLEIEDLAEKKAKIYARLLIEPALAGEMEKLATQHGQRRLVLERLLYGKTQKGKGMSALKDKGE